MKQKTIIQQAINLYIGLAVLIRAWVGASPNHVRNAKGIGLNEIRV
jgi:hypothetical protein